MARAMMAWRRQIHRRGVEVNRHGTGGGGSVTARHLAEHATRRPTDVDHFEHWSQTYDRSWLQPLLFGPVHDALLRAANEELPRPRSILDVGCGTGRLLRRAAQRFPGARLVGVDPAAGMLRQARAAAPRSVRFEQGTAEALPLPGGSFDLVFTTLSFHHWADQAEGLRELRRVVRPQGRILLADATLPRPLHLAASLLHLDHGLLTTGELDALIEQAELRLVRRTGSWRVPYVPVSIAARQSRRGRRVP